MKMSSSIFASLVMASLIGAFAWLFGAPITESLLIVALATVLGIGMSKFQLDSGVNWPILVTDRDKSPRRELSRLAMEVAGVEGRTTSNATEYLSRLARARLEAKGVALSNRTQAEALIGPLAYSVALEAPVPPLRHYEFERCVVDLERLDTTTKSDELI